MFKKKEFNETELKRHWRVLKQLMEESKVDTTNLDVNTEPLYENSQVIYECCSGIIKEVNKLI